MMNTAPDFSKSMLMGLHYLISEAETHNRPKVARVLHMCMRDVCIAIDNEDGINSCLKECTSDESLFAAFDFLRKYASIKNESVKKAVRLEIESLQDCFIGGKQ